MYIHSNCTHTICIHCTCIHTRAGLCQQRYKAHKQTIGHETVSEADLLHTLPMKKSLEPDFFTTSGAEIRTVQTCTMHVTASYSACSEPKERVLHEQASCRSMHAIFFLQIYI